MATALLPNRCENTGTEKIAHVAFFLTDCVPEEHPESTGKEWLGILGEEGYDGRPSHQRADECSTVSN